ncbi:MAG TPA: glycosyltransferase family 39 protein, partial [Vicinamibacterales bacterium]|nr:glycosyltransferase family 39 protein [Vicinamibacterales bacterium]
MFFNLSDPMDGKRQQWGETWYQPLLYYLTAPFVWLLPFTITTARLPMAVIGGVITPLLMFAMARRVIGGGWTPLIAALIVALAPTHVVLSRQALDYVLPLPFVIGWMICLHAFVQTRQTRFAIWIGALLGVGCYSYIASWALMPAFLLVSWAVMIKAQSPSGAAAVGWVPTAPILASAIAFTIPVAIGALWVIAHPEMIAQTMTRYGVTEGPKYGFFETYLSMWHPTVLFVRGGPSLVTSTARSGFVLLPVALLLIAGGIELWRRRDWFAFVVAAGLVLSPLPAAFKGEPSMIQRAVYLLPFLALVGAMGWAMLWRRSLLGRSIAIVAVAAAPFQFGYFYFDYFTHYKLRSAFYYDNVAFRDVARYLMAAADTPAYFFSNDLDDGSVKWRFYTIEQGREALLSRTTYFEAGDVPAAP